MKEITQGRVRELFDYNEKTGELIWKLKRRGRCKVGTVAGCLRPDGYNRIHVDGKNYLAHRLIYLFHYGNLPKHIDHIDNNPSNSRVENLRECSHSQNLCNRNKQSNNTSGFKNVFWERGAKKWKSHIRSNGKVIYLGLFTDPEDAAKAADLEMLKRHGEFALTNFSLENYKDIHEDNIGDI